MDESKYTRTVALRCPTCAGTAFSSSDESPVVSCSSCGLEITREELQRANSENINAHLDEIGKEAVADLTKKLNKSLADAFRGNKFIKVR